MRVILTPILSELRALYDVEGVWPRFQAYVKLLSGGPEPLPTGQFSPMGRRQAAYLDALLALGAEGEAARAAREVEEQLGNVDARLRLMLVVVDEPRNGWTQRDLTDAVWRFPGKAGNSWVTVQLWTDALPTADYVRRETRGSLYRAAHQRAFGSPVTLADMLAQEGRAAAYAGEQVWLDAEEIAYTREVIAPLRSSAHFPTCFAALYGDAAARRVGYPPLGLSEQAGFALALYEALQGDDLVQALASTSASSRST